jgi:hypothetical protein
MATAAAASTFLVQSDGRRGASVGQDDLNALSPAVEEHFDNLIAGLLRGDIDPRIAALTNGEIAHLLDRAWFLCVLPLLFERLGCTGCASPDLMVPLRRESLARGMWELRHQQVLSHLFAELHRQSVRPICFKGTALAYTIYPKPHLRTRCDTDLLVDEKDLPVCRETLVRLGYTRQAMLPGELVSGEELWNRRESGGISHAIDLHWRINNARSLAELFTYDELMARATPIPQLGGAMAVDRVSGLIIGAIHRGLNKGEVHVAASGRPQGGERLYWVYDVHLIAGGFNDSEWTRLVESSRDKGAAGIVLETLDLTAHHFRTHIPDFVRDGLRRGSNTQRADRYLKASRLRREISDVFAHAGGTGKFQYMREVLFPPADYLLERFPGARVTWLPWLHLRRWAGGVAKRFRLRKAHL